MQLSLARQTVDGAPASRGAIGPKTECLKFGTKTQRNSCGVLPQHLAQDAEQGITPCQDVVLMCQENVAVTRVFVFVLRPFQPCARHRSHHLRSTTLQHNTAGDCDPPSGRLSKQGARFYVVEQQVRAVGAAGKCAPRSQFFVDAPPQQVEEQRLGVTCAPWRSATAGKAHVAAQLAAGGLSLTAQCITALQAAAQQQE